MKPISIRRERGSLPVLRHGEGAALGRQLGAVGEVEGIGLDRAAAAAWAAAAGARAGEPGGERERVAEHDRDPRCAARLAAAAAPWSIAGSANDRLLR